jgi:hypothetical protein
MNCLLERVQGTFKPGWSWTKELTNSTEARLPSLRGLQMMLAFRSVLSATLTCNSMLTIFQPKMVYASSKDALKRALNGIATEFQANDEEDIEYGSVLKKVSKGGA